MKCGNCGTELRTERFQRPAYETKLHLGASDRLRYQADANEEDAAAEVDLTCEVMRSEADLLDTVEEKLNTCGGSEADFAAFSSWLRKTLFRHEEQVQVGMEEVEEASDCPRCHGAY